MSPQVLVCRVATRYVATLLAAKGFCLAMTAAFGTAVDQISAALLELIHGERGLCAVAQQALQPGTVGSLVDLSRVKRDRLCIWQRLKYAIDHAHVEVHMRVQTGAKPVDESDRTQVQVGWV